MTFEKALEAMKQGKNVRRKSYKPDTIIGIDKRTIRYWFNNEETSNHFGLIVQLESQDILADDWEIYEPEKKISEDAFSNLKIEPGKAFTDLWFVKANEHTAEYAENVKKKTFEAYKLEPYKEKPTMYTDIEITFKSGDTITYSKDEWDDYSYDGTAVCVKKDGTWVGIYNFNDVFSVELKTGE